MSRVVVIGAGAMGLAAGYWAAKRGHAVTVLGHPSRGHGGAFRLGWSVDRALLPFRLQVRSADLRAARPARYQRQDVLGADLDGLLRRRRTACMGRPDCANEISQVVTDRETPIWRDDVPLDQA